MQTIRMLSPLAILLLTPTVAVPQAAPDRETPRMREHVRSLLSRAQTCSEHDHVDCARRALGEVDAMTDLNTYEAAQLSNFYAFLSFKEGNYPDAIAAYESVLQRAKLPLGLETTTMYTLSQLYFREEKYEQSLDMLDRWFSLSESPGPERYIFHAQIRYQLEQYQEGIDSASTAIQMAVEQNAQPDENWYRLLNVLYSSVEDVANTINVLETMIPMWPKREYYLQLASVYGEVGEDGRQLELYEIAYAMGWLTKSSELVRLTRLLLRTEKPEKAERVLKRAIEGGTVDSTDDNLRILERARQMRTGH